MDGFIPSPYSEKSKPLTTFKSRKNVEEIQGEILNSNKDQLTELSRQAREKRKYSTLDIGHFPG